MALELRWPRFDREDVALLAMTPLVALLYGIAHDHVTATLAPEYFLVGKDLMASPLPFRWAVTLLAVKASWAPGLLVGFLLRFANAPSPTLPRLSASRLARAAAVPLLAAFAGASVLGLSPHTVDPFDQRGAAEMLVGVAPADAFVTVWRIHAGSYGGGLLGAVLAVALVRRERRRLAFRS